MRENNNNLLFGILIGTAIAGTAAAIFANRGRLSRNLSNQYQSLRTQIDDVVDTVGNTTKIVRKAKKNAQEWTGKANKVLNFVKKELNNPRNKQLRKGLIAGGLLGGLLAAGSVVLITRLAQEQEEEPELFSWKNIIKGVQSVIANRFENAEEEVEEEVEEETAKGSPIGQVLDFALSGAQLWNKFRHR